MNERFDRMVRLAARDPELRALVAAVVESAGLESGRRDAILRDFLARGDEPGSD